MTKIEEKELKFEIQHIFDSGANEIRIFEMVKTLVNRREGELNKLPIPDISVSDSDVLLQELDAYARDYDSFDYGLPIAFVDDTKEINDMRDIVKNWFHSR